jgi:cell division septation protein DedD
VAAVAAVSAASPPPAPLPSAATAKPSAKPSPPRQRAKRSAGAGRGWRVQLVSLRSAAAVRREWTRLKKTHRDVLRRLRLTVKTNRSGSLYRLQAGPLSNRKAAKRLCATIKRRRLDCIVVRR